MPWGPFETILLILAAYRLTHVLVFDRIAKPLRDLFPGHGWIDYLVRCYWCAGVWLSFLLVGLLFLLPRAGKWIVLILAVAGGQAILETILQQAAGKKVSRKRIPNQTNRHMDNRPKVADSVAVAAGSKDLASDYGDKPQDEWDQTHGSTPFLH